MSLSIRRALALACAAPLMGVAAPAASQTLTLASAIEQTLASNPELRVYRPRLDADRARAAQAALKPPLELQAEVQDAFGTGRASGFDIAETTFALSQVVELGGKRERLVQWKVQQLLEPVVSQIAVGAALNDHGALIVPSDSGPQQIEL